MRLKKWRLIVKRHQFLRRVGKSSGVQELLLKCPILSFINVSQHKMTENDVINKMAAAVFLKDPEVKSSNLVKENLALQEKLFHGDFSRQRAFDPL